jgi:hypothetical protein
LIPSLQPNFVDLIPSLGMTVIVSSHPTANFSLAPSSQARNRRQQVPEKQGPSKYRVIAAGGLKAGEANIKSRSTRRPWKQLE